MNCQKINLDKIRPSGKTAVFIFKEEAMKIIDAILSGKIMYRRKREELKTEPKTAGINNNQDSQ